MLADRSRLQGKGFLSLCIVKMCSSVLSILFWKPELSFLFFRAVKQMVSYKYGTYKLATLSAKSTWIVRYMYKFTLILVLEYLPFAVIYIACTVEWSTSKTMFILLILLCIIDQLKWLLSENHSTAWSVSISSSWYWNKIVHVSDENLQNDQQLVYFTQIMQFVCWMCWVKPRKKNMHCSMSPSLKNVFVFNAQKAPEAVLLIFSVLWCM